MVELSPDEAEVAGDRSRWRSPFRWFVAILIAIAAITLLSVNTFPVMTDDSVVYLRMSVDLSDFGWIYSGFRQAGYPVVLASVRALADVLGADPLLMTALLQRALLVAAGIVSFAMWRLYSLPLIVFLLAVETVAYPNLILIEGLGLPLAVLVAVATVSLARRITSERASSPDWSTWLLAISIAGGVALLFSLRFTYVVFGAIPLFLFVAGWRSRYRRVTTAMLISSLLAVGILALGFSLENQRQFGVFAPSVNGEPTEYYYAWLQVFGLRPENREIEALAGFYDDGDVYDFGTELNQSSISSRERAERYEAEIEAMLDSAGISPLGSRLQSALWVLVGGRIHDIASVIDGVVTSTRWNIDAWMYRNGYALEVGARAFADEFNSSRLPAAVITDPIGVSLPVPHAKRMVAVLLPLSLVVMVWSLRYRELRVLSLIGLTIVFATALGLGWVRADNYRFLLPSAAAAITFASAQASGRGFIDSGMSLLSRRREAPPPSGGVTRTES